MKKYCSYKEPCQKIYETPGNLTVRPTACLGQNEGTIFKLRIIRPLGIWVWNILSKL